MSLPPCTPGNVERDTPARDQLVGPRPPVQDARVSGGASPSDKPASEVQKVTQVNQEQTNTPVSSHPSTKSTGPRDQMVTQNNRQPAKPSGSSRPVRFADVSTSANPIVRKSKKSKKSVNLHPRPHNNSLTVPRF